MTVHVGILGGGGISDTHARAASAIPGVEVVAVHGDNADKARRLAAAHHVPDYPTIEAFLAHRPMDVVAIGSPSGCHSAQAIACARAGLHVLVEKPMAVTTEDAATLIDACDTSGVRLGVFFQDRLQPDLVRLKAFLDAGGLGRILLVAGHVKWYRPPEYYKTSRWRGTWALDGGGAVMNQGIHTLDLMLHLLGDVATVFGAGRGPCATRSRWKTRQSRPSEFRSGALGTFEATTAAYPGYKRRLEISGERGHDRGRARPRGRRRPHAAALRPSRPLPRPRPARARARTWSPTRPRTGGSSRTSCAPSARARAPSATGARASAASSSSWPSTPRRGREPR